MLEAIAAAVGLLVCVALLLHMALPARQRHRIDAALRRAWHAGPERLRQRLRRVRRGRDERQKAAQAAAQADELIRRARRDAKRDSNVIHPDAFKRPRKPH